jgi:hypothetical protein
MSVARQATVLCSLAALAASGVACDASRRAPASALPAAAAPQSAAPDAPAPLTVDADTVRTLVSRLDLERYKATIKGLTQFGDRRQGTDRNRRAIDWIEAQLRSYGCVETARLRYEYAPATGRPAPTPKGATMRRPRPSGEAVPAVTPPARA